VPEQIDFKTKPEIALEHIRWACEAGLPGGMVLVDAGYGHDSKLRTGITELGKVYAAGIQPQILVWTPGQRPGDAPKKGRRDAPAAISAKEVALRLPAKAWRTIEWREGTNEPLSSRFAAMGEATRPWLFDQERNCLMRLRGEQQRPGVPGVACTPSTCESNSWLPA